MMTAIDINSAKFSAQLGAGNFPATAEKIGLTAGRLADILCLSPTLAAWDWRPRIRAAQPQSCGFFVRKISALHHHVGLGGHPKGWPVLVPVRQLTQSGSMIGVMLPGLKNLLRDPS